MTNEFLKNKKITDLINHKDRYGSKRGCIKLYPNNTLTHERIKAEIGYKLLRDGFDIYSEARIGKLRPDLIAIKNGHGYIIEILHSEDDKKFKELKGDKIPKEFTLRKVDTKDFDINKFKL